MGDTGSRGGGEAASMDEIGHRPLGSNAELVMVPRSRVREDLEVGGGQGRDGNQGFSGQGVGAEQELCPGEEGALGSCGIRQVSGVPGRQLLGAPLPLLWLH